MRISIPVSFWALLVTKLNYADAFTPPNLQNYWIGNSYGDIHNSGADRRHTERPTSFLQRLWATQHGNASNDTDPDARRIRSAYLQWCEKYKKQVDENRYPQFVSNYKVMQSIALKGGKPMHLNEFADFTAEEYEVMMSSKRSQKAAVATSASRVSTPKLARKQVERTEAINRDESYIAPKRLVVAKPISSAVSSLSKTQLPAPPPQSIRATTNSKPPSKEEISTQPPSTIPKDNSEQIAGAAVESSAPPTTIEEDRSQKTGEIQNQTKDKESKDEKVAPAESASNRKKVDTTAPNTNAQSQSTATTTPGDEGSAKTPQEGSHIEKPEKPKDVAIGKTSVSTISTSEENEITTMQNQQQAQKQKQKQKQQQQQKQSQKQKSQESSSPENPTSQLAAAVADSLQERKISSGIRSKPRKKITPFDLMKARFNNFVDSVNIDEKAITSKNSRKQSEADGKKETEVEEKHNSKLEEKKRIEVEDKRKAEEERIKAERKDAEAKAKAEAKRKAEEERKQIEAEVKKAEEEKKRKEAEVKRKAEEDRKRIEAEAQQKAEELKRRKEAEAKRKAEEERKRKEAETRAKVEAEARRKAEEERKRIEAEAKRKAEEESKRIEAEANRKAEEERKRIEAEAKAKAKRKAEEEQKRIETEAKRKAEEERKRIEAEAKAKAEAEAERKAEEERKRIEAEAKQKAEEERKRIEAEAKAKRKAEEERKRIEAEAKAERKAEEERKRIEAEAKRKAEEERKRIEAEAKAKREAEEERKRIEAEAKRKAEEERKMIEAEAKAKREAEEERKRIEEEAKRKAEEERKTIEAEAKAKRKAEEERKRIEAEAKRKAEEERKQKEVEARAKAKAEAEARRKAEADRKRIEAEAKAKAEAEARRKAEEERKRIEAETKKKAEEERKQKEVEAKRKAEEERKRIEAQVRAKAEAVAEAKRKAEEERKRIAAENKAKAEAEEKKKAEEERKRIEATAKAEARAKAEAEAKRKAEEERKRLEAEAKAKAEADAKRKAEEERKRIETAAKAKAEAEAKTKAEAEAMRKAEEERKRIEAEARKKAEEEKKRIEAETKLRAEEERNRIEAEAKAKAETEARLKKAEELRIRIEAEEKARAAEEQKKKAEEERIRIAAEAKAKSELKAKEKKAEEVRLRIEAEEKARAAEEDKKRAERVKTKAESETKHKAKEAREEKLRIASDGHQTGTEVENREKVKSEKKSDRESDIVESKGKKGELEKKENVSLTTESMDDEIDDAKTTFFAEEDDLEDERNPNERNETLESNEEIEEMRKEELAEAEAEATVNLQAELDAKEKVEEEKRKIEEEKAKMEEANKVKAEEEAEEARRKEEEEELRIRAAYLDWCLEFSKKPDKVRIKQFKQNYLMLEGVAKEEGKEIKLNEYADYTAVEYQFEMKQKEEAKKKEEEERLKLEQEETEAALLAARGEVGTTPVTEENDESKFDGSQAQGGIGDNDESLQANGMTNESQDEWWKQEEGLDESLLQTGSRSWSGFNEDDKNNYMKGNVDKKPRIEQEVDADDPEVRKRVRTAYSGWCRMYNKEPDETRFPKFKSNYLIMEKLAIQKGREVFLNEFADCTPDEYEKASRSKSVGVSNTSRQLPRKEKIEQDTKQSERSTNVEPVLVRTKRNMYVSREEGDEEVDQAAIIAEVEKIAMAKAEEAAQRVEKARMQKVEQGIAQLSRKISAEERIKRDREATKSELEKRREEALRIEAERVANANANAKKVEENRRRRQWEKEQIESRNAFTEQQREKAQIESRNAFTEQQRLRREQEKANNQTKADEDRNRFEVQQRDGRTPAFIPTKTSSPRGSGKNAGMPEIDREETQPVVKPPTVKAKNPFQRRPTFTSPAKGSNVSESNDQNGFDTYSPTSWQDQGVEATFDTNGSPPSESDYENINGNSDETDGIIDGISSTGQMNTLTNGSTYQIQPPPPSVTDSANGSISSETEETSNETFNNLRSFDDNSQATTSRPDSPSEKSEVGSVSNYDGSYFMNVSTNSDEEPQSFDYIQNWSSSNQDLSKRTDTSFDDPTTGDGIGDSDTWYDDNGTQTSTDEPSTNPYIEGSSLMNKGASYLENLSKPDSSSPSNGTNGGDSFVGSATRDSQQEDSSQSENIFPERIKAAYRDWCQYYGKEFNESRLGTFSSNFLAVERYHRETGVSLILNELADMTSEEFQQNKN